MYHFRAGLPYAVIASKWFICIFAEVLPAETVLRIWDCVFSEGYKVFFIVFPKHFKMIFTVFLSLFVFFADCFSCRLNYVQNAQSCHFGHRWHRRLGELFPWNSHTWRYCHWLPHLYARRVQVTLKAYGIGGFTQNMRRTQ